jgi:hypothetical protein
MSASRIKKPFPIKALTLWIGWGFAPAWAVEPESLPQPQPLTIPAPADPAARTLAPAAGDRDGAAVEIQELSAPDPNAAGALPPGLQPLGASMWKTLTAEDLNARLERLPAFERSAVMQGLTRRMLLSPSAGPKGGSGDGVAAWFATRVRALNARGDWAGAMALADYGPLSDPAVAEAAFTARLAASPREDTCESLKSLETPHEGQFWSQLRIYCQFVGGDTAGAQLALDVLREKGVNDPAFTAAAAKLLDGKAPANPAAPDNAVQAALWRLAAMPLSMHAARNERPEIAALAETAGESDLVKLAGAGLLTRIDVGRAQAWTAAVESAQFAADQKDDPEEAAKPLPPSAGDAVYLRSISARTLPAAKASAFAAMLQRGQARGEFPYTAKLLRRAATEIAPVPETAWAAPEVTRVLIYNGEVARAESWFKALNPGSPSDQPTINAVQIYGVLKQPSSDPGRAANLDKALQWLVKTSAAPGPNQTLAKTRMAREFPVLAALGKVIPPDGLWAVDANSPGVALGIDGPTLLEAMARAADQGAAGEVVLNAAILLNGQGAAAARSQTVAAIVRALKGVGLRREAEALALEAFLGQGQRGL